MDIAQQANPQLGLCHRGRGLQASDTYQVLGRHGSHAALAGSAGWWGWAAGPGAAAGSSLSPTMDWDIYSTCVSGPASTWIYAAWSCRGMGEGGGGQSLARGRFLALRSAGMEVTK